MGIIVAFATALVLILLIAPGSVKIVREYRRLVLFRLGRCVGTRGPGFVMIIPVIDRVIWVDLREQYFDVPHQQAITKDNAPISIDFVFFYKVLDPVMSVVQISDFSGAASNVATTTLRAVVGDMSLDEVLARRDHINETLRVKLDEITERWGVKVTNVEIREVIPPRDVQEAMTKQMSAERARRAQITESEGQRQATINVSEGEKEAAILVAEGDRRAEILRAEGYAKALETVYAAASNIDAKTMGIQYLEALKKLGSSASTKFVIPLEFSNLLAGLVGFTGRAFAEHDGDGAAQVKRAD